MRRQWKRVIGKLPGALTAELPEGDDYPVGNVNFAETEAFCQKLTMLLPGLVSPKATRGCGPRLVFREELGFEKRTRRYLPGPPGADGGKAFRVFTVAETDRPIRSQGFLTVTPQYTIANCPKPDIVVIPGGATAVLLRSPAMMKWVREAAADAEVMFSVCTGAFVLADAGLLDGKEATTHAYAMSRLKAYPKIKVREDRRVVDNGKTVTAAGVSAGIDGALHLVGRLCGPDIARSTAKYMEYRWQPEEASPPEKPKSPE